MAPSERFVWNSACITDVGNRRSENQDACLDRPDLGLWVVADGMGGHQQGSVASHMLVDALNEVTRKPSFSAFVDDVEDRILNVNKRLVDLSGRAEQPMIIGSTVAALLAFGAYCVCLWAGDSRIYLYRGGRLAQLTRDHSQVEEMLEQGAITREQAENHPSANVIDRAVGAESELHVDADLQLMRAGDRFLLCSDGLNKELSEAEIADFMPRGSCREVCDSLISVAKRRECRDNITVVVVEIQAA